MIKLGPLIKAVALFIGSGVASTGDLFYVHQPTEPEGMKKYKK